MAIPNCVELSSTEMELRHHYTTLPKYGTAKTRWQIYGNLNQLTTTRRQYIRACTRTSHQFINQSSFVRLLMWSAKVKRVVLASAAMSQQVPLGKVVCETVIVPAHVVWLVGEVAFTDTTFQHTQITPALVVLSTNHSTDHSPVNQSQQRSHQHW